MTSREMDILVFALIVIYGLIILISLSFDEQLHNVHMELLIVEIVLLTFFLTEIILKIYAFEMHYLSEPWNIFDTIVVLGCFIITAIQLSDEDTMGRATVQITGLLRLLRIVILFRKINEMRKLNEKRNVKNQIQQLNITSPAERLTELLNWLISTAWIQNTPEIKSELEWAVTVIQGHKLYEMQVEVNDMIRSPT